MSVLMDNPAVAIGRLADIENDLAQRQNEYERAAEDVARAKRDYDLRLARALVVAEGSNAAVREANALIAVAAADDGIYTRLTDAEARYAALKVVVSTLSERASIGQSILKAQSR
jgi:hypothetical protein